MSDPTHTNEDPQSKASDNKSLQAIIAGGIGEFLLPFFFIVITYWLGNSGISPFEALFLDPLICGVFGFILARVLIGGVFGYWAYLIFRRKKPFTVISAAFLRGRWDESLFY